MIEGAACIDPSLFITASKKEVFDRNDDFDIVGQYETVTDVNLKKKHSATNISQQSFKDICYDLLFAS